MDFRRSVLSDKAAFYLVQGLFLAAVANAIVLGKEGSYSVLRGSTFRMSCIPKDSQKGQPEHGRTSYAWTDQEGRELVDARYIKSKNGDLKILNAHVGDSGTFKCKIRPSESSTSKIYEHQLVVYELAGHKFIATVKIDMSRYGQDVIRSRLRDLMAIAVCLRDLCKPGDIKSLKCEPSEMVQDVCEYSIAYEAIMQIADEKCDEVCVRERMLQGLKKAQVKLQTELLRMSEDPRGRLKADMTTFDTKHLITCRGGYHLVKEYYKRCFPCRPGYYSESNSVECRLCNTGFYQEHYGKHECDKCEEGMTTDIVGAKSRDECIDKEKTGILNDIKEGIVSLFKG